jgi:hypothetical protein
MDHIDAESVPIGMAPRRTRLHGGRLCNCSTKDVSIIREHRIQQLAWTRRERTRHRTPRTARIAQIIRLAVVLPKTLRADENPAWFVRRASMGECSQLTPSRCRGFRVEAMEGQQSGTARGRHRVRTSRPSTREPYRPVPLIGSLELANSEWASSIAASKCGTSLRSHRFVVGRCSTARRRARVVLAVGVVTVCRLACRGSRCPGARSTPASRRAP